MAIEIPALKGPRSKEDGLASASVVTDTPSYCASRIHGAEIMGRSESCVQQERRCPSRLSGLLSRAISATDDPHKPQASRSSICAIWSTLQRG